MRRGGLITNEEWGVSLKSETGRLRSVDISVWAAPEKEPFVIDNENKIIQGNLPGKDRWNIISYKTIGIAGKETVIYTATPFGKCQDYFIRIINDDYIYWFQAFCDETTNKPDEVFFEILSTFKFIEQE